MPAALWSCQACRLNPSWLAGRCMWSRTHSEKPGILRSSWKPSLALFIDWQQVCTFIQQLMSNPDIIGIAMCNIFVLLCSEQKNLKYHGYIIQELLNGLSNLVFLSHQQFKGRFKDPKGTPVEPFTWTELIAIFRTQF